MVDFAHSLGLKVVPELECFGHASYITKNPQYSHLRDELEGMFFDSITPCHPDTKKILKELLTETVDIFKPEYLHIGLDETAFGNNPFTKEALKSKTKVEIFAEHIIMLHDVLEEMGVGTILWGDHLRPKPFSNMNGMLDEDAISDVIAEMIPKDIIICDWIYDPGLPDDRLDTFLEKGFKVLACPATSAHGVIGHPRKWNFDNIRDFAKIAANNIERGVVGMVNTVWCSGRYLPGLELHGVAYGGAVLNAEKTDNVSANFAKKLFGLDDGSAFDLMNSISLHLDTVKKLLPISESDLIPLENAEREILNDTLQKEEKALKILCENEARISRNEDIFANFILTAELMVAIISGKIKENFSLKEKASQAWDKSRFSNDPYKFGLPGAERDDYILQRLARCEKYIKGSVKNNMKRT